MQHIWPWFLLVEKAAGIWQEVNGTCSQVMDFQRWRPGKVTGWHLRFSVTARRDVTDRLQEQERRWQETFLSWLLVCVCLQVSVLETVWACVSVCLTSPEEMPFLAAGGPALAVGVPSFACCLATSQLIQHPPAATHTHTLPSAARQADRVGAWCQLPPPPITKTLTPHKFVFDAKTKTRGKQKTRMDQNKISVH